MTDRNKTLTISELMLYLYFIVMYGARALGIVEGNFVYNVVLVIGAAFIFVRLISTEYTLFEIAVMGGIFIFAAISYVLSGEKGIVLYLCLMFGLKGISSRNLIKTATLISAIAFPVLAVLSLTGIKHDTIWYIRRGLFGTSTDAVIRWSLGYHHSNVCHIVFLILCAMILYLTPKKRTFICSCVLAFWNVILYFYTYSRTGVLCVFLLIGLNGYWAFKEKIGSIGKAISIAVYPVLAIGSVILPYMIKPGETFDRIDALTSWRLSKSYNFIHDLSIPILGQRLDLELATMLDSSYLYVLGQNGLLVAIIMLAINIATVVYLIRKNDYKALAVVLIIQIAGSMEPFMYNISFRNIAFIFYGEAFFSVMKSKYGRNIRILKLDNEVKTIGVLAEMINGGVRHLVQTFYRRIGMILGISAVIGLIFSVFIALVTPWPTIVYSCDENYVDYPERLTYLTQKDVREIEDDGGLVINYKDDSKPVYDIPYDYGYVYWFSVITKTLMVFVAVALLITIVLNRGHDHEGT